MRILLRLIAAVALLVLGAATPALAATSPSPAPSASTSPSGATPPTRASFGLGTTTKGVFDARPGISIQQAAGSTYDDTVGVINLSKFPLTLRVYVVDVVNNPNGDLAPLPYSAKRSDAATWVTLHLPHGSEQVTVPAQGKVLVPLTVHIPPHALVGDHMAGVMASLTSRATGSGQVTTQIDLEQRVGIRLGVRVAGAFTPALEIHNLRATYMGSLNPAAAGSLELTYEVVNTGNVRLGGDQQVTVRAILGSGTPATLPTLPLLLPGGTAQVSVVVPDVRPVGPMEADLTIAPRGAKGDSDPGSGVATASTRFWAIPWTLLALLLVIGLGVALWLRLRNARPAASPGKREAGREPALTSSGVGS